MINNNNKSMPTNNIPLTTFGRSNDDDDESSESDSDSDAEVPQTRIVKEQVDPTKLGWVPWLWYYSKRSANKTYEVCDAAGEKLAWFLGITKPKYYAEIQEYERMDEEEREAWRQAFQDVEQTSHVLDSIVTVTPPTPNIFTISQNNETRNRPAGNDMLQ